MEAIRVEIDRLIVTHGAGDPAVLEAMLAAYSASVYRLALSILHDPADAQDAAQETFLRAAAALHRYQVGTNFKAWLLKIAVNNCRMALRKRAARQSLHLLWETLTRFTPAQPGPEAQLVQAETRTELWDLVDTLDEKHRLVVVLRLAHQLTVSEISQALGLTEKTVYTRLYAAFAHLRGQARRRPEFAHLWDEVQP